MHLAVVGYFDQSALLPYKQARQNSPLLRCACPLHAEARPNTLQQLHQTRGGEAMRRWYRSGPDRYQSINGHQATHGASSAEPAQCEAQEPTKYIDWSVLVAPRQP